MGQALHALLLTRPEMELLTCTMENSTSPELRRAASRVSATMTVRGLLDRVQQEIEALVGRCVVQRILDPDEVWEALLAHLFASSSSQKRISSGNQQIRVIASRHRA